MTTAVPMMKPSDPHDETQVSLVAPLRGRLISAVLARGNLFGPRSYHKGISGNRSQFHRHLTRSHIQFIPVSAAVGRNQT